MIALDILDTLPGQLGRTALALVLSLAALAPGSARAVELAADVGSVRTQVDAALEELRGARAEVLEAAAALQEASNRCISGRGEGDSCRELGASKSVLVREMNEFRRTEASARDLARELHAKADATGCEWVVFCDDRDAYRAMQSELMDLIENPAPLPEGQLNKDDLAALSKRAENVRNLATVLADGEDKIDCSQGDASLLGMGMDCGLGAAPANPERITSAPAFVSSDQIEGGSAVGNGAVVMRGDTLGEIAQKVRRDIGRTDLPLWGAGGLVDLIAAANGFTNPDRLSPKDGVRIPTKECLIEAAEAGSRQVLAECEELVRVNGVPEDLQGAMRRARERMAEREKELGRPLTEREREGMLEDITNANGNGSGKGGASNVSKADFIRLQTELYGESYRPLITMMADRAELLGYSDAERLELLYRQIREAQADRT